MPLLSDLSFLKDPELDPEHKRMLLEKLFEERIRDRELNTKGGDARRAAP